MPPMTAEGERRAARMKSSWSEDHWDWVDDFNSFDRCITRGMPAGELVRVLAAETRAALDRAAALLPPEVSP